MARKRKKFCVGCTDQIHQDQVVCRTCGGFVRDYKGADKNRLSRIYGMTPGEHGRLFAMQKGRCAICGSKDSLVVDHDHSTGAVRGLLCSTCNLAIGQFRDDPLALIRAVAYLMDPPAARPEASRDHTYGYRADRPDKPMPPGTWSQPPASA